jgi:Flp pilus assembly protein TadD
MIPAPLIAQPEDGKFIPTAHRFYLSAKEYSERGNVGAAEHCLVSALRLDPNHHAALTQLGCIAHDRRQFAAALALTRRAVNLEPKNPAYLGNYGNALFLNDRYLEAAATIIDALKIAAERRAAGEEISDFGLAGLWHNLGLARMAAGKPEHAVQCFRTGLALAPGEARIRRDLGIALLGSGHYSEGLIAHEARWDDLLKNPVWDSGIPRWEGEDLEGKTIIVHHEQGFGDTIQFCRFLPWLRQKGAHVIASVPQPLWRLMEISGLADEVVDVDSPPPPADYHSPMLSVPAYLGLTLETLPNQPYLKAPEIGLGIPVKKPDSCSLMVGVVWSGSSHYVPDLRRSMPFKHLLALTDIPHLGFVSLQKGERVADIANHGMRSIIGDLSGILGDFADTAAALMQVDVVVSVDTSVLHLAGALGRPTIALLANWRCWRWLTEREDTPWYDNMRLVTQEHPGDWDGVMATTRAIIENAEVTLEASQTLTPVFA